MFRIRLVYMSHRPTEQGRSLLDRPRDGLRRRDFLTLVRQTFADRYTVDREIGGGAAARVFLALDRSGRKVALKILRAESLATVATDRFLREIQFTSRLKHPRIAEVLDSGECNWLVYYVTSFIEGPSLRQVINSSKQLTVADTVRTGCELLDALGHAHERGIIHRDVKPENVVISPNQGAVLLDLGIARAIIRSTTDEQITQTDIAVGTAAYMSPEQINASQEIDVRSDLYAVGCVLFECLTGRPPFVRREETLLLQLHLTEPAPDVRVFRRDVPPALAAAITTALAKLPQDRCLSAQAMQADLMACDHAFNASPARINGAVGSSTIQRLLATAMSILRLFPTGRPVKNRKA